MGRALRPLLSYAVATLAVSLPAAAQEAAPDAWLGADKPVHVLAAGWAAGAGYAAGVELDWDPASRRRGAVVAALAVSIAKEVRDRWTGRGPVSFKDLAADGVGIALVLGLTALADH